MCDKIGLVFFTLLIALFRMAEFIFIPQVSPITPPVICAISVMYHTYEKIQNMVLGHICYPIFQLVFSLCPYVLVSTITWAVSTLFYVVMWIVWWTMYLSSVWKYLGITGRTLPEILKNPHGSPQAQKERYTHYLRVNRVYQDIKTAKRQTQGKIRSNFQ